MFQSIVKFCVTYFAIARLTARKGDIFYALKLLVSTLDNLLHSIPVIILLIKIRIDKL